ncbi:CDGSH iron-sulfur domain-containing protein [Streptomyces sp. NPDC091259]|uniref:CDGSH iron-sulfur domain-containing protein n=1 Tax=Streptomyces sp. NPDC091259 TaxID=3365976 RepID=UPI003804E1AA
MNAKRSEVTEAGPASGADRASGAVAASGASGTTTAAGGAPVRHVTEPDGPELVEGPVERPRRDGSKARSERPVVAVCTCRRSRIYPWCDTSHRARTHGDEAAEGSERDGERP